MRPSPAIVSLSPTAGVVGTPVTITGANFGATKGTSTVTFNGTVSTPTSWAAGSIVVPVPAGATTGSVVVTVGGVASNAVPFTVVAPAPSITSLSPTSGVVGTTVTITGANFGATQGTSTVTFNGTVSTPTSWAASSIVVPVPTGATTGNVVVTVGGLASNALTFTVTTPGRDWVWQNTATGDLLAWHMNGLTETSVATVSPSPVTDTNWKIVGSGDFNGDGQADLVWQHQTLGYLYIWFMNGDTATSYQSFSPAQVADTNWKVVAVGDLDR